MKLFTIETIPGQAFEALDTVKGTVVYSKNFGRDFMAGMKTLVGGEITGYTEMLNEARQIATKRMVDEAEALGAEKLILLTDVRGLLRDPKDEETLIHVLHTYDVPALIAQGIISGGMIPKMECSVEAIHGGVERVHILDGRIPHSILIELLSDRGIGTMLKKEDEA